jgi:hypothetical protein
MRDPRVRFGLQTMMHVHGCERSKAGNSAIPQAASQVQQSS